jgi:hypothetical protein
VLAVGLLVAPECLAEKAPRFPDPEIGQWDAIPRDQLDRLWEGAQESAGVIAVEPYTSVVGPRAAKKKTWAVADQALKFFAYGYEPIWFPADVLRRTVCGKDTRWSYFWHGLSGDESDLHPWFRGRDGFRFLLGDAAGSVGSGAVDVAPCSEVYRPDGSGNCVYGEVSPTAGFDAWFCGGRGATCRAGVNAMHLTAPSVFSPAQTLCVHGPFVLERVHGWRPEVHPAEVLWTKSQAAGDAWMVALIPDTSKRFDASSDYVAGAGPASVPWRPWSSERPVELWAAFAQDDRTPLVFDLSMKVLGRKGKTAHQVTLEPPGPGAFKVLAHGLEGVLVAAKTWPAGNATTRGFLVMRTLLRRGENEAVLLRLTSRRRDESPPPPEIEGVAPTLAPLPETETIPAVRMLGEARQQPTVVGSVAINTLVRFDPRRPSVPPDEEATDRLNEALKGSSSKRRAAFGKERPFRVEWDLTAVRANGDRVPVVMARPAQLVGLPPSDRVRVAAFPGPATEEIRVTTTTAAPEMAAAERKPVSLGQLVLSVPDGVTVTGQGRVTYTGTTPLGLPDPAVTVTMRYPPWSYRDEWELVGDVLAELDPAAATRQLSELREEACAPAPPSDCASEPLAASVAKALADPVKRWDAARELQSGNRPFARFVRLFARDLRWDGMVSNDERDLLKKLLAKGSSSPP